jgi:hypothetical protein
MSEENKPLTAADLAHFTGSEVCYHHALMKHIVYTEGVQFLAERAGAYWLIDIIVSVQHEPKVKAEAFQVWTLKTDLEKSTGVVICEDGNGYEVYRQKIDFTDFPLAEIKLYFTGSTILLTSEY